MSDSTHKTKSGSRLLDYIDVLDRPETFLAEREYKWFGGVAGARGRGSGGMRGVGHLVTNHYQAESPPRAVKKSLAENALRRSTHIQIQIALLRF